LTPQKSTFSIEGKEFSLDTGAAIRYEYLY